MMVMMAQGSVHTGAIVTRKYAIDMLYFINNNAEGTVRARAVVSAAIHSEKMTE